MSPRRGLKKLSFVFPIYNEEENIPLLRRELEDFSQQQSYECEWVIVNDGSNDQSAVLLEKWAKDEKRLRVIEFSRNFGHQMAITAGLDIVTGEAAVVMDADLQDPLEAVPFMVEKFCEGYDVVYGTRAVRKGESIFKRGTAAVFYWLMKKFVFAAMPRDTGDFRLMSQNVIGALQHFREGHRFLRGLIPWLGFSQTSVSFVRQERLLGVTKFSVPKMLRFALNGIVSFSDLPLVASVYLGLSVFIFGSVYGCYAFYRFAFGGVQPGWTSTVILLSILGGAILICLGVLGIYVGKIFEEIKQRPLYVVSRTHNLSLDKTPSRAVFPASPRDKMEAEITRLINGGRTREVGPYL